MFLELTEWVSERTVRIKVASIESFQYEEYYDAASETFKLVSQIITSNKDHGNYRVVESLDEIKALLSKAGFQFMALDKGI